VCLGATDADVILGTRVPGYQIQRTRFFHSLLSAAARVLATVHPSSLLRGPDDEARRAGIARFVEDLAKAGSNGPGE
jgi:DNA polymerase